MDARVEIVVELMKHDRRRNLSLNKLASMVNLSPARLSSLFKAETGTSPSRYLKLLRMNEAKILLSSTFLSVKEILAQAGFTDVSHFVRDFKRIYGITPTEYRRRNLNIDPIFNSAAAAQRISANK